MLIVGEKEQATGSAGVRMHGEGDKGMKTIEEIMVEFSELNDINRIAAGHQVAETPVLAADQAIEHAVPDARND
jgi:hypothetical protein